MQEISWSKLSAVFAKDVLEWRIIELSSDASQALVRPQLPHFAVNKRLNSVLGAATWSNRFFPIGTNAVACELSILSNHTNSVSKSALASFAASWQDPVSAAYDAFVYAAEGFGLLPGYEVTQTYWVDYDPEANTILFEPEALEPNPMDIASQAELSNLSEINLEAKSLIPTEDETLKLENAKPQGQQAIDRLLERLKEEGLGLEAAKLSIAHGGYGDNPDSARELYSKLRMLLVQAKPEGSPA